MKIAIKNPENNKFLTEKYFNTEKEAKDFQKKMIKLYKNFGKRYKNFEFHRLSSWINASLQPIKNLDFSDWDIVFYNQNMQHTPICQSRVLKEFDNQIVRQSIDKRLNKKQ